jgi:hypothetical protein
VANNHDRSQVAQPTPRLPFLRRSQPSILLLQSLVAAIFLIRAREKNREKEGKGARMKEKKRRRTFLHNPLHTGQSESSSEDGRYVRDVHLVIVVVLVKVEGCWDMCCCIWM